MNLTGVLAVAALAVQGDMKVSLDAAVYPQTEGEAVLELSYDIPFNSMAFVRDTAWYVARYRLGIQLLDEDGEPVAGDFWRREVWVDDYDRTVSPDSSASDMVSIMLVPGVRRARVEVSDLSSARQARADFKVERPSGDVRIRFLKSGAPNPTRSYSLGDTVEAVAELLKAVEVDSFRFRVKEGRRVVRGGSSAVEDSAGRRQARFLMPVADSAGIARIAGGEYVLEAVSVGTGQELRGKLGFTVRVPFFFDDDAYDQKVDELLHIASQGEMRILRDRPPAEREQAWNEFWHKYDPTPTTERNEKEEEYFARIEYAKENFSHGDKGFRSDRARVYVKLGKPDNVDAKPFEIDSNAYEIWSYYSLGLEFLFVDRYGFGEYELANPRYWDGR